MPKNPLYAEKIVLSNGGVIETVAGTDIVSVSALGVVTVASSASSFTDITATGDTILGNGGSDTTTLNSTLTVGVNDTGYDVKLFGATSGSYALWDESADKLIINAGTADLGTSCEADAYTVGGTAGVDFNGAITTLTTVKGIVTAAS